MKKTQEEQAISDPREALDAIEAALMNVIADPKQADAINGATLRPLSKLITRETDDESAQVEELVEYSFIITQDGAGCDDGATPLPEPERLLIEA